MSTQDTQDQTDPSVNPEHREDTTNQSDDDLTVVSVDDEPVQTATTAQETVPKPEEPVAKPKHKWSFHPEYIFIPPLRRRLGTKAKPLGVLLIVIIVFGLGGASYWRFVDYHNKKPTIDSSFKLPVVAFKLDSTVPADKATNVNTSTQLVLNFSQPVTPAKLINNMFLTPKVSGTYKQGSNSKQVIFTPSTPFSKGSKVNVMINGTYESNSGSQLGKAYDYNFTTSIPSNSVLFQDQNGLIDQVTSLTSGQKESYSLLVGNDIGSGASVTLYKGDVNDMLSSLVYQQSGNQLPTFSDLAVSTDDLTQISVTKDITNNQKINVQEPDGLYVAVATNSSGDEVGLVWVDFSNFGVLMRQDDKKVVMDAQQFSNSNEIPATVDFYNLNESVSLLSEKTAQGLTTVNFPYSPSVDMAVATYNGETAVVPINVPNSGGDIRVDQDLSTAQQVYGVTDRQTYEPGDSIHYAGFVRNDNDAQYVNSGYGTVKMYVATYKGGTPLTSFTSSIDANGMFSGSFSPSASWINSGDSFDQYQIFVSAVDGNSNDDLPLASFTLASKSNSANNVSVKFSKASYLPNDQITATITATNPQGQPLANKGVQVHTYSQDYYENDPTANAENFGYNGSELPGSPSSVQLNSSGQATFTINAASLPADGSSQQVTVQANLAGYTNTVGNAGGDSAIVHQGNAVLTFAPERTAIPTGSSLTTDIYAKDLNNNTLTNTTINYQLVDTNSGNTLASGTSSTDNFGKAHITIPSSQLSNDGMKLEVMTTDSNGNKVEAIQYFYVNSPSDESYDTSGAGLSDLNVTGSSGDVKVGDTVNLTINSPTTLRTMVTMDRGRIYNPTMITLNPGNNSFSFTVGQDLAPSFTLTFSYFRNGIYHSEGVNFNVDDSSQKANVTISQPSAISANKVANLKINTEDSSGNPLATTLIVDIVSANSYSLSSSVAPDIFSTFFDPRPIMTSSSSSLSPVGSGGGRCGGGGGEIPSYANPEGTTLFWQPGLATDSSGQANVSFNPPAGNWIVSVYAMSGDTQVGSATSTFTAN